MANPQRENGFTAIAHEILEVVQMHKFTLNEMKIILAVWRFTYGFNRKSHTMSLTFFTNHTGLSRSRVNASLKNLIELKVIIKSEQGNANTTSAYSFNKNYETWKIEKYASFADLPSVQDDTSIQDDTSVQDGTSTSVQDETTGSVQDDTQERKVLKKEKDSSSSLVDPQFKEILKFYTDNLQLGITMSPYNYEIVGKIYDEYKYDLTLAAMKVSAKEEKKGVSYLEGVLKKWKEAGVKNLDDARKYQIDFKNRLRGTSSNKNNDVFGGINVDE